LQQRQNGFGRLPQRGEVHHVIALETLLEIAEKLLNGGLIHVGKRVKKICVEIFLRPLLRALNRFRQRNRIIFCQGKRRTRQKQHHHASDNFHRAIETKIIFARNSIL